MIACHRHILGCQKFWTAAWRGPIPHVRRILRLQDKKIKESDKRKKKKEKSEHLNLKSVKFITYHLQFWDIHE